MPIVKKPDVSIQRNIQIKSMRAWNILLRKKSLDREIKSDMIRFLDLINKELDSLGFAPEPHGAYRYVRFHNNNFDDNYLQARNIYIHGTIPSSPHSSLANIGFLFVRYYPNGEREGRKETKYILDVHRLSIRQITQIIIELLNYPDRKVKECLENGYLYTTGVYKLMMGTFYQREQGTNDDDGVFAEW